MTNIAELMREAAEEIRINVREQYQSLEYPSQKRKYDAGMELPAQLEQAAAELERAEPIHIIFDGPPSRESGRFVEVETPDGRSINAGEWVKRDDGLWALVIPLLTQDDHVDMPQSVEQARAMALTGMGGLRANAPEELTEHFKAPHTSAVPEGWKIMRFTGTDFGDGSRWEIYDETGSGGAVDVRDVRDETVRKLLDWLSATPQPGGSE